MSEYDDWLRKPEIQAAIQAGEIEIGSFTVEPTNGGYWAFEDILQGDLPDTPLHQLLRWRTGVSLMVGKSVPVNAASRDEAANEVRRRCLSVNIAGVFARAREKGIEPRFANVGASLS